MTDLSLTHPSFASRAATATSCRRSRSARPTACKASNPYNKLFEDRIIFLGVQIDDASANDVMAQLLVLESMDPDRDISIYINSPGGSFTALTAIYDTMQFIQPDIQTVCLGQAASAAAVLLAAGTPGQAARAAEQPHPDPPALHRGHLRPGLRHRDPGQRDPADARAAREDARRALRQDAGAGQPRHRARQDPHRRGGHGVRPDRRGPRVPQGHPGLADRRADGSAPADDGSPCPVPFGGGDGVPSRARTRDSTAARRGPPVDPSPA